MSDSENKTGTILDDLDHTILNIAQANPDWNNHQIAKQLVKIGQAESVQLVYQRLKKKDYLRKPIQEIRNFHKEQHTREIFPLAQKKLKKALKTKDLDVKTAFNYVKLAYDKELSDSTAPAVQQTQINIETLQAVMGGDFTDKG